MTDAAPLPRPRSRADGLLLRVAAPLVTLAGAGAAFAYVGAVDPNQPGHYPLCPLLHYTGLYCPGCGGLRAAHAVAHGDLATAFGSNALVVAGFAVFACGWIVWLAVAVRGRPPRIALPSRNWPWWTLGALFVTFTVVRNLPFGAALTP